MNVYVDLDGVLADFDSHYEQLFGERPSLENGTPSQSVLWKNIRSVGTFFRDLPVTKDGFRLWDGIKQLHAEPIILTGMPNIVNVFEHKTEWVRTHIDFNVEVICCPSRKKCQYAKPGDILIDDWLKYRHLWEQVGGVFIHHKGCDETLSQLKQELERRVII